MEVALFPSSKRFINCPFRSKPMLLVIIFTILALSMELEAAQHFTNQPSSITANLGDKVTLPCTVAERKGTVQWTKDGFGLGTNRTLHGFDRYEMIGSAEQGEYNLYIRMVLVSDDAEYQCQVGAAQGDPILLSSKARLTVHVPPKNNEDMVSIDRASPVAATAGTPIRLSCIARSSKPAPEIKWFNGQKEITSGTNTTALPLPDSLLVSLRSMLDLTPDKSHHNANISCVVSHVALETPIVRSVMMEVIYPPEVTISVDSAKIKEGDEVTFTCQAEGNPNDLLYRWEVGGVTVVGGDQGSTYVMQNVTRDKNNVNVVCFVTNAIGVTSATHTLSVTYEPVFKAEPVNVDGDVGSNVSLFCDVDGNPKPEVVWTHQNSDKVIKLGRKISVSISESTIGTYHCRATVPGFAEKWRSLQVFMRGSPQVPAGQASYGLEGSNIELRCVVHALPRPTSLKWSRDGHVIYPNDIKYTIREDQIPSGIVNTLSIHSSNYDDFGSYNCTAKNKFGTGSSLVELHRQQSLPLIHTLVAIIGGIVFLVIVVAAIVLFRRKGLEYKDSSFEKHSMHSNDHSSTNDSVLKVDTRTGTYTGTASELSPSDDDENDDEGNEDDEDCSHEEWESTNVDEEPRRMASRSSYRSTDIEEQTNTSGAYMQYVDYQRDYNPPPPPPPPPLPVNYNRNTIYTSIPLNNIAMDPRYNISFGSLAAGPVAAGAANAVRVPGRNPVSLNVQRNMRGALGGRNQQTYLRLPSNSRVAQNNVMYGSSGALVPQPNGAVFSPNLGPPNTNFGADVAHTNMSFGASAGTPTLVPTNLQSMANNLNDPNTVVDKNAIYSQISRNRNNLRNSNLNNSQYISIHQNDLARNGLGTHI